MKDAWSQLAWQWVEKLVAFGCFSLTACAEATTTQPQSFTLTKSLLNEHLKVVAQWALIFSLDLSKNISFREGAWPRSWTWVMRGMNMLWKRAFASADWVSDGHLFCKNANNWAWLKASVSILHQTPIVFHHCHSFQHKSRDVGPFCLLSRQTLTGRCSNSISPYFISQILLFAEKVNKLTN